MAVPLRTTPGAVEPSVETRRVSDAGRADADARLADVDTGRSDGDAGRLAVAASQSAVDTGQSSAASMVYLSARRWVFGVTMVGVASVLVGIGCLAVGAESLAVETMWRIVADALTGGARGESTTASGLILLQVRLPRVALACLVGGALAAVGVGLQALLRNPLADPYVLGISSGAALGATVGMLLGAGGFAGVSTTPVWAFLGGLLSILAVYRVSVTCHALSVHTLLLAGVILNALCAALIMFAIALADPAQAFKMMMWLMGSLTSPTYSTLLWLGLCLGVGGAVLFWLARSLNVLTMGDDVARALGVESHRVKKLVFVVSALMTGAVVSIAGPIGFVGMIVPHAVRMVAGADHRLLLPVSALVGGAFLMVADTAARTMLSPTELPVGVVTALVGGPIFLFLLMKRRVGVAW